MKYSQLKGLLRVANTDFNHDFMPPDITKINARLAISHSLAFSIKKKKNIMRKPLVIYIVLVFAILFGCKKEDNNLRQLLSAKSWEQVESGLILDGSFKEIYKVTFELNGEYELVFRQLGVMPRDSSNSVIIDTLIGNYELSDLENTIKFKPTVSIASETDTLIVAFPCDTIYYYISDWHIIDFNETFLEIEGEKPEIMNKTTCSFISFVGKYHLETYEE